MAQRLYCQSCQTGFPPDLTLGGGKSCPACGTELVRGRVPAGRRSGKKYQPHASRAVWDKIIKSDPCCYCNEMLTPKEMTIDHIQPKALGGSKGSWTNRSGSCRPCNGDKAHTPLLFFMLEQRGMDLSHLKDEEGNWPIPEMVVEHQPESLPEALRETPRPHELINLAKYRQFRRPEDERDLLAA